MIDDFDFIDDISDVDNLNVEIDNTEYSCQPTIIETSLQQDDHNLLNSVTSTTNLDLNSINSAESFLQYYSGSLTIDDVNESIHSASVFFNMDSPMIVSEGWTTGIFNRDLTTVNDDVLIFNAEQLQEMGITEKEGLDLVMTHENTHRALQNMDTGFSEHQEELCGDYMAGVRAGLNSMDVSQMVNSLINTPETITHPAGVLRVEAIKEGQQFASDFLSQNGHAPTFDDCLEHFKSSVTFEHTTDPLAIVPNTEFDGGEFHGFVDDKEWHEKQAQNNFENAEWHRKEAERATARGDYASARDHISTANSYDSKGKEHLDAAKKCTK